MSLLLAGLQLARVLLLQTQSFHLHMATYRARTRWHPASKTSQSDALRPAGENKPTSPTSHMLLLQNHKQHQQPSERTGASDPAPGTHLSAGAGEDCSCGLPWEGEGCDPHPRGKEGRSIVTALTRIRRMAVTISTLLFGRGTSRLPMYCTERNSGLALFACH